MTAPLSHQHLVDSLRGWAAFSVLIMHTFRQGLLPEFPGCHYAFYLQADRAAVLLFFVISGYVIGLSTRQAWSPAGAREYGWRRAVRIGPVYLLAIGLAWLAVPAENWRNLLGHLAFLQDSGPDNPLRVDNLTGNTPLWSLHYEALYYALFLVWWRWPGSVGPSLVLAAAGGLWATGAAAGPGFVISHSVGAIYWLSGLLLSRGGSGGSPNPVGRILANILWIHAVYHLGPVFLWRAGLHWPPETKTYLPLGDLVYLPLCVTLVTLAGIRRLPGARWWQLAAFGTALAGLVMVLAAGKSPLEVRWGVGTAYLVSGLICFLLPLRSGLGLASHLGGFSYALYALHFPILLMLGRRFPARLPPASGLGVVLLAWLVVLPLAWWIERRLQPRLRVRLDAWAGFAKPANLIGR
jgi:peptidoglycan/LPS O-acetylase OafA/YrhL